MSLNTFSCPKYSTHSLQTSIKLEDEAKKSADALFLTQEIGSHSIEAEQKIGPRSTGGGIGPRSTGNYAPNPILNYFKALNVQEYEPEKNPIKTRLNFPEPSTEQGGRCPH